MPNLFEHFRGEAYLNRGPTLGKVQAERNAKFIRAFPRRPAKSGVYEEPANPGRQTYRNPNPGKGQAEMYVVAIANCFYLLFEYFVTSTTSIS